MRSLLRMIPYARLVATWRRAKVAARATELRPVLPALHAASEYVRDNGAAVAEWTARAERVAAGELSVLSAGNARTPVTNKWRTHPLSQAPISRFEPMNFESFGPGDLWLASWLNTLPYAPLLAHGSAFLGNPPRACLVETIDSWVRDQSPIPSPFCLRGLEVSLRAVGMLYAWSMARHNLPETTRLQIAGIALLSGEVLERATGRQSYNHLIVEAFGLFCIGLALRRSEDGKRWIEQGAGILEGELRRQFFEDGMHAERSPGYMLLISEIYLHFNILATRAGLRFSPTFQARVLRMCEASAEISSGNALPAFSDNAEISLFSGGKDLSAVFALAAAVFSRSDFRARAGQFPVPAFWIAGDQGYRIFRNLPTLRPRERGSGALTHSGFYIMRCADQELRVTCGRELSPKNGHSHADLLSFEVEVCGDRVLADAGTCSYYPLDDWRQYFRATRAHNTVTVDGQDQAEAVPGDSFGWVDFPKFELRQWRCRPEMDVFEAEHCGYTRLKEQVIHRRKIIFRKPGCWILLDEISGTGEHDCDLHFQFTPGEVYINGGCAVANRKWGRFEIWQLTESSHADLVSGSIDPIRGWISLGYGNRTPAPSLRFRHSGRVPVRFCTVMLAASHDQRTLVRSTSNSSEQMLEIHLGDSIDLVRIRTNAEPVFSKRELTAMGELHGC